MGIMDGWSPGSGSMLDRAPYAKGAPPSGSMASGKGKNGVIHERIDDPSYGESHGEGPSTTDALFPPTL